MPLPALLLARDKSLTDEAVVARVLAGETELFEILMRRYNQRLFRCVRAILRRDAEAEDALQAAYIAAYTSLGQFQSAARFSTWMTRIAINEALGRLRKTARRGESELLGDVMSESRNPEEQVSARELVAVLEQATDDLPEIYRVVFVMRELEGLSTAETGECLGLSEEAVKVRLHRAKAFLRERIAQRVGEAADRAFAFLGARCDRMVERVLAAINEMDR